VVHVDDLAERAKRRIGRPSRVEGFRKRAMFNVPNPWVNLMFMRGGYNPCP